MSDYHGEIYPGQNDEGMEFERGRRRGLLWWSLVLVVIGGLLVAAIVLREKSQERLDNALWPPREEAKAEVGNPQVIVEKSDWENIVAGCPRGEKTIEQADTKIRLSWTCS